MAYVATQPPPGTSSPSDGSRTMTIHDVRPLPSSSGGGADGVDVGNGSGAVGTLRLRGGPRRQRERVRWTDDVVDNEHMGKKKSKSTFTTPADTQELLVDGKADANLKPVCCIYHKPRKFDESSSEESSSDSDSDSSGGPSRNRIYQHNNPYCRHHRHSENEDGGGSSTKDPSESSTAVVHKLGREGNDETNAYERSPGKGSRKGKGKADDN